MGVSPTTNEEFYSGDYTELAIIAPNLDIGSSGGALNNGGISQADVEKTQERVDRLIDGILSELYYVPLRHFNRTLPNGDTEKVFAGDIRKLAQYWTVGLLMQSQFQQSDVNISETAIQYIESSMLEVNQIVKFGHRIQGQRMRSNYSRTMPPSMQVGRTPEEWV